jgi:hypothetical protein
LELNNSVGNNTPAFVAFPLDPKLDWGLSPFNAKNLAAIHIVFADVSNDGELIDHDEFLLSALSARARKREWRLFRSQGSAFVGGAQRI